MKFKAMAMGLILAGGLAAQASAQSFRLGLQAGGNVANVVGSGVSSLSGSLSSRIGLVGGVFLQLNFGDTFAIQPEVLYSQKGSQTSTGSGSNNTIDLSYVEIPVLFKFYLPTPGVKPNLFAGGAVNFNTAAQLVTSAGSTAMTNINSTDFGIIGGAGVDIDKFSLSGRYELGLNNISTTSAIQNGTITVLLGYSFI